MIFSYLSYIGLRMLLYPLSFLPYSTLHKVGNALGYILYFTLPKYRKRIFSNLSLASDLSIATEELPNLAIKSLGSLASTCLEYGKLLKEPDIHRLVSCENPEQASAILSEGKGLIFLCAHQANWELFFLEGTSRMPGVAIGQPIKNPYLYAWILKIRQRFGGIIVPPQKAVKEGLRALKQGKFLGIVGDQGMPESGFCSPFLGRSAWTSPLPALLAYRNNTPIITATMKRQDGKYKIRYSEPFWPNKEAPMEQEIPRLMRAALLPIEQSIKDSAEQWLWSHNRWKQQLLGKIKKPYRQDAIAILLPYDTNEWEKWIEVLPLFREIYPTELLALFTPRPLPYTLSIEEHLYTDLQQLKIIDYRFKLLFNFTGHEDLTKHFCRLSVLKAANLASLVKDANLPKGTPLPLLIKGAILHAG